MKLELLVAAVGGGALVFLMLSLARLRKRRFLAGGVSGIGAVLLLVISLLLGAAAVNIHTYQRLTHEEPVARLQFSRQGSEEFIAELRLPSGSTRPYRLQGDQWQLDARVLKWRGIANLLGLDAQYRLERLSGRYRDIERERLGPRTVYPLARAAGLNLWDLAQRRWLPWVDATYGSATYLPMADKAGFEIRMGQSGLIARPLNASAKRAVRHWR